MATTPFLKCRRTHCGPTIFRTPLNGTFYGFSGVYLNPFGPSNPALLNALFFNSSNVYKSTGYDYDLSANGSLFTMPALAGLPSAGNVPWRWVANGIRTRSSPTRTAAI